MHSTYVERFTHITSKESVYIRKEFNFYGTGLGHQHGGLDVILILHFDAFLMVISPY